MWIGGAIVTLLAALASLLGTAYVVHNAVGLGLLKLPNQRSSHVTPTPNGGGLGIAAGGLLANAGAGFWMGNPVIGVCGCGLVMAMIGFRDDTRPLPARWRLLAQVLTLGASALLIAPMTALKAAIGFPGPEILLFAAVLVGGTYWINLFNFMDGIDGIAASQGVFMCAAALGLLLAFVPHIVAHPAFWWLAGLGVATLAFLWWNFPPARVFMGDVGSQYLGLMLAVLGLFTIAQGWLTLWAGAILAAAFVSDATVTLVRRLLRRERVFDAHRRHAYQFLSRRFGAHRPVTLLYAAINIVWLLPLAVLAQSQQQSGPLMTLVAYCPLLVLAVLAGAGRPEHV